MEWVCQELKVFLEGKNQFMLQYIEQESEVLCVVFILDGCLCLSISHMSVPQHFIFTQ